MRAKPSDVFRGRVRELRTTRATPRSRRGLVGLTQAELAERLTELGRPMSKTSLMRLERGERDVSLDEALAITAALDAVPAFMLTPPDDADVEIELTGEHVLGSGQMREWLRKGTPAFRGGVPADAQIGEELYWTGLDPENLEDAEAGFRRLVVSIATDIVDAYRGNDNRGVIEKVQELVAEVELWRRVRERLAAREGGG
jgi:transcriptional regulator with XRE-family HTH domain